MTNEQKMVEEFMRQARQDVGERPVIPNPDIQQLRLNLIQEETMELLEAFSQCDIVKIADAIGDLLYVTYGAALACGLDMEPVFKEIHRSNLTKFIDGQFRADGKYLKGPSHSPANLEEIVNQQSGCKSEGASR